MKLYVRNDLTILYNEEDRSFVLKGNKTDLRCTKVVGGGDISINLINACHHYLYQEGKFPLSLGEEDYIRKTVKGEKYGV